MAGVTTAARMGVGSIASSEAMNPKMDYEAFASFECGGYYLMSNIPQTHRNLRIVLHNSNQSSYTGSGYVYWNSGSSSGSTPSANYGSYYNYYNGWSTGSSSTVSTDSNGGFNHYPTGYSNWGQHMVLDIYNYSQAGVKKPFYWSGYMGSGNHTSYATAYEGVGVEKGGPAFTDMNMFTNYGNGSSSYNRVMFFGFGGLV